MPDLSISRRDYDYLRLIARALLAITAILVFVPLYPTMPGADIDASYKLGLNLAVTKKMLFGKDIVYPYGSYAAIYSKLYSPGTDRMIMFGGLFLGIFTAVLVCRLASAKSVTWHLLFTGFLGSGMFLPDTPILFLYPLLVTLYIYQLTLDKNNFANLPFRTKLFCSALFLPFGLLFLIKGSIIMLIGGITILSAALFWKRRWKKFAVGVCIAPVVCAVFFQLISGQPLIGLWYYTVNMLPVVSGYTEAMAMHGERWETVVYVISALSIVAFCYKSWHSSFESKYFLVLSIALLLFTAFKAGFTRHDGHCIVGATTVFAITFLLYTIYQGRKLLLIFLFSAITWLYISYNYMGQSVLNMFRPVPALYTEALDGLMIRVSNKGILEQRYNDKINEFKNQSKIPALQGTTDFYFYELTYLLASDNTWSPRPVIQSYAAFTPKLAQMNEAHLTGANAPNNIIFKYQTIDNRYPSLDDGLSWPTILNNYQPVNNDNGFLYLKQKRTHNLPTKKTEVYTLTGKIGEEVTVPDTTQMLFAEFDLKQTLLGSFTTSMYQPDPLDLYITLTDGRQLKYRLISGMAKAGFILSPLIESNEEFASLFTDKNALKNKRIKSFKVSSDGLGVRSLFNSWKPAYTVHLSKINFDN